MGIIESLFRGEIIFAFVCYLGLIIVTLPLFEKIYQLLHYHFFQIIWDRIGIPLLRALLMVVFICIAYPSLFGIVEAPGLSTLLTSDELHFSHLINLVFITTLFFPLIPVIGRFNALILPAQGIAATALLFSWLGAALHADNISLFPNTKTVTTIILMAGFTWWLALKLSHSIGILLDKKFNREGFIDLTGRSLLLVLQTPVILIYSLYLGKQL